MKKSMFKLMKNSKKQGAIVGACLLATNVAVAEDKNEYGWGGEAELGYVQTNGNSETQTLNAVLGGEHTSVSWINSIRFEALNTSQNSETSAEKYYVIQKNDYKVSDRAYAFALGTYENDRFSGFEYQTTFTGGYGHKLIQSDRFELAVEIGPGYRFDKIEDTVDEDTGEVIKEGQTDEYLTGRFAEVLAWQLSKTAELEQELVVEGGSENTFYNFDVAIKTQVVGQLSMKVSYGLQYTENVNEGKENTDSESAVTLVYEF